MQTLTLEQKRKQFLDEEVQFFGADPEKYRCIKIKASDNISYDSCQYAPRKDSPGCAIGRKCPVALATHIDNKCPNMGVTIDKVWELLPKELQELGNSFLMECQTLHDDPNNWEYIGLSEKGARKYNDIVNQYCF